MNQFLFITHVTPKHVRSPLRQSLYEIHLKSLINQTSGNWKHFVVGENEINTEKYFEVKIDTSGTQQDTALKIKEVFDRNDVIQFIKNSTHIIKLDDDDIISPTLLDDIKNESFDVYFDEYHTFYDVTSTYITQQKRPWIASTCVHKTEHALSKIDPKGQDNMYLNSVFYSDHSKVWHSYYNNKKIRVASKNNPVYLRILSPTSITAGAKKFPINTVNDIDFVSYYTYLKSFGYWNKVPLTVFNDYRPSLLNAWAQFANRNPESLPVMNDTQRALHKLAYYAKRIRSLF